MEKKIEELKRAAKVLNLEYTVVSGNDAHLFIKNTFEKFKPFKTTGHLSIGNDDTTTLITDDFEFSFSKGLPLLPTYAFFEQNHFDKDSIFILKEGKYWSKLIEECYGMEYFLTDVNKTYFISVNWYTIEILNLDSENFL